MDPERIAAITGRETIVYRRSVASTNDLAWEQVGDATVVIADEQTAGRGRFGRAWQSPDGGIWLSTRLQIGDHGIDAATLPALGAVAACEAVRARGVEAAIKWPNDVHHEGRKLCGVLVEARRIDGAEVAVLGVGLNVAVPPEALPDGAASLDQLLDCAPDIDAVAGDLIARLDALYADLAADGTILTARWRDLLSTTGERVTLETADGERVAGIVTGITLDDRLHMKCDDNSAREFTPETGRLRER